MKRFSFFLAALAFSFVLNAASLNWGTDFNSSIVSSPDGGAFADYTAYLCVGDNSTVTAVKSALTAGTWDTGSSIVFASKNLADDSFSENGYIPSTASTNTNFTVGSYDVFVVILDANGKYAAISSVVSATMYDEGGMSTPSSVEWDADGTFANSDGNWMAVGVPEPTVMALLALGVAGLALRRKVA